MHLRKYFNLLYLYEHDLIIYDDWVISHQDCHHRTQLTIIQKYFRELEKTLIQFAHEHGFEGVKPVNLSLEAAIKRSSEIDKLMKHLESRLNTN